MKLRVVFFLILVCLPLIIFSCRRNQPSLVDSNRPPDTELWYAPPDSTEYQYLVHMYWRGLDPDGVAERYIWTITDTLVRDPSVWNPAQRIRDFRRGRITTKTDSVFAFTAFRNVSGVGLRKNRQAFHIAAIDDNGVIDPSPAAVEFVATVESLPELRFTTTTVRARHGSSNRVLVTKPYNPSVPDTVGMFRPFRISYNGFTSNGILNAYKFSPLTAGVLVPGANQWNPDLSDTVRAFPDDAIELPEIEPATENLRPPIFLDPVTAVPSGVFRMSAQSRDGASAESAVDATTFQKGVAQVAVNFEPDTEVFHVLNTYTTSGGTFECCDSVDFRDNKPDTLPYNSWITLCYKGSDNPFDSSLVKSHGTPEEQANEGIRYQVRYFRESDRVFGSNFTSQWLPAIPEDNNPFGTPDSTSMNIGTVEYLIGVRSVDEYGKGDGTPFEIPIVGNFDPTMDSFTITNHDGTVVTDGDTLVWDWESPFTSGVIFLPEGNPTFEDSKRFRTFRFSIDATGHDHPKDPIGSGIRGWLYEFKQSDNPNIRARFARAGSWTLGDPLNTLNDVFEFRFVYPFLDDNADEIFNNLAQNQPWINQEYDFEIRGRDLGPDDDFTQFMFMFRQDSGTNAKVRVNQYSAGTVARWTTINKLRFFFKLER